MNRSNPRVIIRYRNDAHVLEGPRFREPGPTVRLMLDSGMQTARVPCQTESTQPVWHWKAENVVLSVSVSIVLPLTGIEHMRSF
jgi:hypothetical protein